MPNNISQLYIFFISGFWYLLSLIFSTNIIKNHQDELAIMAQCCVQSSLSVTRGCNQRADTFNAKPAALMMKSLTDTLTPLPVQIGHNKLLGHQYCA